jgi:TRAP-type C4-dicarboxylate transport system substrate-binding protein
MVLSLTLATPLAAQVIKLGSLAPQGSPWDSALRRLADDWSVLSGGRISLRIYPGGIAGDEPTMVRKIRINQLQAAAITGVGLGSISEGTFAVQLPLLIRTDEELAYLMQRMEPKLNGLLADKGFTMLAWFVAGWAHFFSRTPAVTPVEMQRLKLQVDYAVPNITQAWKQMGFHVVPIASTEVLPALQSGMIDAFVLTPLTAAAAQWFGPARNMSDLRVAPMIGGIIVSQRTWNAVPAELQPRLVAAVDRQLERLRAETEVLEQQALRIMRDNGLQVQHVPPQVEAEWQRVMEEGFQLITGSVIPAEMLEEVRRHLREFRSRR